MIFNLKIYKEKMNTSVTAVCIVFSLQECIACTQIKISPFLRCLDFGVCKAIRLVRFGYNTFTGCVV